MIARLRGWGATKQETGGSLPGDDLIGHADLSATRAVSIAAGPPAVWPWIAQIGQDRGGFYSYDFLENLAGCHIHSADRIVPQWQDLAVGDIVRLAPPVGLTVAAVEPCRWLVLRVPAADVPPPYDFTWSFVLREAAGGGTRLLVRERYGYASRQARLLVPPLAVVSFVMSQKMLRGIKARAEHPTAPAEPAVPAVPAEPTIPGVPARRAAPTVRAN